MFHRSAFKVFVPLTIAVLLTIVLPIQVRATEETRGKILFLRCASCHDTSNASSPKIGPNLAHVFERPTASLPDYPYSPALRAKDFIWDAVHLDAWLTNPSSVAPGTTMAFAGMAEPADRQAVIAYLQQLSANQSP